MSQTSILLPQIIADTPVRTRRKVEISIAGYIYIGIMLVLGVAGISSRANLLYAMFGLMIGILLVQGVGGAMMLRRLHLRRVLPEFGRVGESMAVTYEMSNRKAFWPSVSVLIAELDAAQAFARQPHTYLLHAAPRGRTSVPTRFIPKRRGQYELNRAQMFTSFPFGFVRRAKIRRSADKIVIYPPVARVDPRLLQRLHSGETSGAMIRPRRGGADEFYGVKEYRAGENPRWIYWRRSARTGTLVSKEMTHVSPPRMLLMVDTFISQRTIDAHATVERAIAMAGSIVDVALDQDLAVGLLAWAGEWIFFPPARDKRHQHEVLAALAKLPLNTTHDAQLLLEESHRRIKSGVSAVLLTPQVARSGNGGFMHLSSNDPKVQQYFQFEDAIDFRGTMPTDQRVKR